jgi:hypothetical protein
MNYQKIYDQLIDRAKTRKLEGYKERHHIIPKCLGGNDEKENLVDLTAREHYIAHIILCKIYPDNKKLYYASWMMINRKSQGQDRDYVVSSRMYQYIKENLSHTDETKEKFRNKKLSMETRNKISETLKQQGIKPPSRLGWTHSDTTKEKLRILNSNKKITAEQIEKMRKTKLERYGDATWNGTPKSTLTSEERLLLIKEKRRNYYLQNRERILQGVKDRYIKNKNQ